MSKLRSVSLFSSDAGEASVPRSSGLAVAEARQRLKSWGSQVELAEEFERGMALSCGLEPSSGSGCAVFSHPARKRRMWFKRPKMYICVLSACRPCIRGTGGRHGPRHKQIVSGLEA